MTCPFRSLAVKLQKWGPGHGCVHPPPHPPAECRSQEENLGLLDSSLGVMKVESRASGTAAVLTGTFERPSIHCLTEARYEGLGSLSSGPDLPVTGHASPAAPS